MSHLFGHLAPRPDLPPPGAPGTIRLATARVRASAGGLAETAFGGALGEDGGWLVVGVGMRWRGERRELLDAAAWARLLAGDLGALDTLDGHFAAVRWRGDRLEARTDSVGGRSLYLARARGGVAFSTRLDWLCRFAGLSEVDWSAMGSHWLAANRFGPGTFVRGVERLAQGGRAHVTPTSLRVENRPWSLGAREEAPVSLEAAVLRQLRALPDETVSLGLSGGLDSRGLAARLKEAGREFVLHTFGPEEHPDGAASVRLARRIGTPLTRYEARIPSDPEVLWQQLQAYAAETVAATPMSAGAKLGAYAALHARGLTVLDGGFGEIARRDYYKRLRIKARAAVLRRDASRIAPHVRADRGDFFAPDVRAALERGFADDLAEAVAAMPEPRAVGVENWLDLLAIRARLPNFAGYAQPRADAQAICLTPFVSAVVLARPARASAARALLCARQALGPASRSEPSVRAARPWQNARPLLPPASRRAALHALRPKRGCRRHDAPRRAGFSGADPPRTRPQPRRPRGRRLRQRAAHPRRGRLLRRRNAPSRRARLVAGAGCVAAELARLALRSLPARGSTLNSPSPSLARGK